MVNIWNSITSYFYSGDKPSAGGSNIDPNTARNIYNRVMLPMSRANSTGSNSSDETVRGFSNITPPPSRPSTPAINSNINVWNESIETDSFE